MSYVSDSDDSVGDPDFDPVSETSSESDSDTGILQPPAPVTNVQKLRPDPITPSTAGTTSPQSVESQWVNARVTNIKWKMATHNNPPVTKFDALWGMKDLYTGLLAKADPIDFYDLFLSHDVLQLIVDQTNLYATQNLLTVDNAPNSRSHAWVPVTIEEILQFLALIGWMGLVKLPSIKDYWRNQKLYGVPLARSVMPRNRFELILKYIHFADNLTADTDDRLYKIRELLDKFIANFQKAYTPGERICVDESLIPWRGRLIFRQYIPNKAAKYGIKVYKLCTEKGYTWNMNVYCGKSKTNDTASSEKIVMQLIEGLLDEGRTLYTDNYYTSIPLAYRLKYRKTNLVGTLRAHRKHLPKDVIGAKLKRGEMSAQQTEDDIVVLKWRDKRDVNMLSTRTSALKVTTTTSRKTPQIMKPDIIIDYNRGKSSIDLSDQMATYGTALRRCTKWYRKLVFELIWGTSLVNAFFLYNETTVNTKKLTITEFREQVIQGMLERAQRQNNATNPASGKTEPKHYLIKNEIEGKKLRGRCSECYLKFGRLGKEIGGKIKRAPQINTKCSVCEKFYCQKCFNATH